MKVQIDNSYISQVSNDTTLVVQYLENLTKSESAELANVNPELLAEVNRAIGHINFKNEAHGLPQRLSIYKQPQILTEVMPEPVAPVIKEVIPEPVAPVIEEVAPAPTPTKTKAKAK